MNYSNPDLVDQLAAEYVIGTLHGQARARFKKLLAQRKDIELAVLRWEQHFASLAIAAPAVEPPRSLWRRIHSVIKSEHKKLAKALKFWKFWGVASTVAASALVVVLLQPVPVQEQPFDPNHIALVGEQREPLWVISANLDTGVLSARALNAQAAGIDKAFELWMLPENGAPQSIGLLPVNGNRVTHTLPAGLLGLLKASGGLAISIEPSGGSPTGLPTGPVIQTAKMLEL